MGTLWTYFEQLLGVWTFLGALLKMTKMCPNRYSKTICPNGCPKFGHIIDIFWTYLCTLDRFSVSFYKCPNKYHKFGCFLDMMSRVGHFLGMIWTHFGVWSHFWTHYRHIWEFCVQNVSIPTSCSSAQKN